MSTGTTLGTEQLLFVGTKFILMLELAGTYFSVVFFCRGGGGGVATECIKHNNQHSLTATGKKVSREFTTLKCQV